MVGIRYRGNEGEYRAVRSSGFDTERVQARPTIDARLRQQYPPGDQGLRRRRRHSARYRRGGVASRARHAHHSDFSSRPAISTDDRGYFLADSEAVLRSAPQPKIIHDAIASMERRPSPAADWALGARGGFPARSVRKIAPAKRNSLVSRLPENHACILGSVHDVFRDAGRFVPASAASRGQSVCARAAVDGTGARHTPSDGSRAALRLARVRIIAGAFLRRRDSYLRFASLHQLRLLRPE